VTDAASEVHLRSHLMMAFATPVVAYPWRDSDELNRELAELVLADERKSEGVSRSNVGGWHSASDLLDRDAAPIRKLRQRVMSVTAAITRTVTVANAAPRTFNCRIDGWANVSRHGHYNSVHSHPNGRLELIDPRAGANMLAPESSALQTRYLITPTPGLMVLFPSWLNHLVHPFFGRGERISIAFNVKTDEAGRS
jgi:uncharacterized protein (TIGR02466 family)